MSINLKFKSDNEKKPLKNTKQVTNAPDISKNNAFLILLKGVHNLNSSESPLKPVKITHNVEISV